jgi:hypothetical protein
VSEALDFPFLLSPFPVFVREFEFFISHHLNPSLRKRTCPPRAAGTSRGPQRGQPDWVVVCPIQTALGEITRGELLDDEKWEMENGKSYAPRQKNLDCNLTVTRSRS